MSDRRGDPEVGCAVLILAACLGVILVAVVLGIWLTTTMFGG